MTQYINKSERIVLVTVIVINKDWIYYPAYSMKTKYYTFIIDSSECDNWLLTITSFWLQGGGTNEEDNIDDHYADTDKFEIEIIQ